jgi:hypothetical protein
MPVAYTEARDPTANDDTLDNILVGSVWINTTSGNVFDCITNAQAAARWRCRARVLGASGAAVSAGAVTSEEVLATITVPAQSLGSNGTIRILSTWSVTNSANNKTLRLRYSGASGTIVSNFTATTQPLLRIEAQITNTNTTTQTTAGITWASAGNSVLASTSPGVDTTADTTIVITGQKASSGETLTLVSYNVELTRPDIT